MEMLGKYQPITALSNKDAGSCRWCYAVRGGQTYFIKEFLEPKYPEGDNASSPERRQKKLQKCMRFEQKKTRVYRTINENSDGIAVRITDFFRVGAKYYVAMPKISGISMEAEDVVSLPDRVRRTICAVVTQAVAQLHRGGFIHADIKHSNVMIMYAPSDQLTAKLIDYDAGYFEDDPPTHPEEIGGDQVYFAPEVFLAIQGMSVALTRSLDVFSLGILLHQYLTGTLPAFDMEQFSCVGEAVAYGSPIAVSGAMSDDLYPVICQMLSPDPAARPTAMEVYETLIAPLRVCSTPVSTPAPYTTAAPAAGYAAAPAAPVYGTEPPGGSVFVGDAPAREGWQGLGDL